MQDAGRTLLMEGLKKSIDNYDKYKEQDKKLDIHCSDKDCTGLPYLMQKTDRLDDGQNLILRWILIQEKNEDQRQESTGDSFKLTKDGIIVHGSRAVYIIALAYIILKMNGISAFGL
jgi:hypothetical protein